MWELHNQNREVVPDFRDDSHNCVVLFKQQVLELTPLVCVVEEDEKLTHIIEAEQFSFKSPASFRRSTATIIKPVFKSQLKSLACDIAPEIDLNELAEVMFRTKNDAI